MLRKFACAAVILTLSLGVALAEEVKGRITKIDGKTYDIAKDVKVCKMVKDAKEALADGLKSEELKDLGTKGRNATLIVEDGKVKEIILAGKKKKAAQ